MEKSGSLGIIGGTEGKKVTNKEHREKIEECAEAFADALNAAISDGMIVSADFDNISTLGQGVTVIPNISCKPSIDRVIFFDESKGCEYCINWTDRRTCRKRVAIQGHAPEKDFKCLWWEPA